MCARVPVFVAIALITSAYPAEPVAAADGHQIAMWSGSENPRRLVDLTETAPAGAEIGPLPAPIMLLAGGCIGLLFLGWRARQTRS